MRCFIGRFREMMKKDFWITTVFGFFAVSLGHTEDLIDFSRDIRPLLSDRCFHCHGPDANTREADLRLDTPEGAFAALDEEGKMFSLVAGDPEKSELFYRITTDDEIDAMPPSESKLPAFTDEEIDLIRRWIEQGADYSELWTFVPVERPAVPEQGSDWATNPIDRFVARKHNEKDLSASPETNRRTLIRRVSFDLTGLPPTPEEVDAFVRDESPEAYEKVVDRLLESPRYGERMAVEWMDAARYADTSGYQYDWFRTMWRWRDWVIDSFNANQPYDEFITWQLAGDLLPEATLEQKIATGFNRNHPFTIEGGVIQEEYRVSYVADRVTTMGTVFMGLTLDCARCHDHKFDPISQKDFYQLFAFFNHLPEKGQVGGKPLFGPPAIPAPTREQSARLASLEVDLEKTREKLLREDPELTRKQNEWEKQRGNPWEPVTPASVSAMSGSEMKRLEDGSYLASGAVPAKEVYEFVIPLQKSDFITGLRIEALTHESMVQGGPGRSSNGNAVLSEIEAQVVDSDGKATPVSLSKVSADYEQKGYSAASAIDGKLSTGWAFDGNTNHADHWIAVSLAEPVTGSASREVRLKLRFESQFGGHSFGRVRLSRSSTPDPAGSVKGGELTKILSKAPEARNKAEKEQALLAFRSHLPEFRDLAQAMNRFEAEKKALESEIPMTMIMSDAAPRDTFILERGAYDQPMEQVSAAVPERLPPLPEGSPANRLGLAQWMTERNHPLTARVTMNRLWHQVFGVGIVKTVNDFGSQAEWPSHRMLLDWLAAEFMESGWDLKHMVKLMVMSSTYRQSSDTTEEMLNQDPENRLLARGPRKRMSAEMIRDLALQVSGLIDPTIGGPSAKPYQPPGLWKELTNRKGFQQVYEADRGAGLYRRGLYTFWKRAAHHPMMSTFDAPNREVCSFSRSTTNTPLQALVLLHDPQFVEAARVLASELVGSIEAPDLRIRRAAVSILAREPSDREMKVLDDLYATERRRFQQNPEEADALLSVGAYPPPDGLDRPDVAATTMVVRAILNLSETITKH